MKDTFYFSHDYNVRTDDKIKKVFRKLWLEWYWLFWCIIEDLYNNANALQLDYDWLAFDYRTTPETIKILIEDFDLFILDWEMFYSKSVQDRLEKRDDKSAKARENANKRWNKDNATAMQPHNDSNAIKESKVKESKINNNIELNNFLQNWNKIFWKNYLLTDDLQKAYIKCRKKYSLEEIQIWASTYYQDKVSKWSKEERKQYELHILKFLSQKNWLANYL